MNEANSRIMMVFSIISRGKAKKFMKNLEENGIGFHFQTNAIGTAPSEMMDIFGLGSNDKDIVISLAPEGVINDYAHALSRNIGGSFEYGGLMMCVRLSAINRISAELIARASKQNENGGKRRVKSAQKHQLILVSVNQGYTDAVMETAKRAGAMGYSQDTSRQRVYIIPELKIPCDIKNDNGREVIEVIMLDPEPSEVTFVPEGKTSIKAAYTGDLVYGRMIFTPEAFAIYADRVQRQEHHEKERELV